MQSAVVYKNTDVTTIVTPGTNVKEYRLQTGNIVTSSTSSPPTIATTVSTTSSPIVTTTMRPPPPPPPPKIKDLKNERGNEEPSSSIPDLGMFSLFH